MLILGLLSLLQVMFLPGALLRRAFASGDEDPFEKIVYTFGLSLIANTWLVTLLVLCGMYTRPVVLTIMAAEVAALFSVSFPSTRWKVDEQWQGFKTLLLPRTFNGGASAILALTTLAVFLYIVYLNWGSVFNSNDDVANWNRWAIEWSQGIFPTTTSWYPQLLPANWSLSYVLVANTDVQMFAKATTACFPLATLLLFVSLARRSGTAFLWGVISCGWLFLHLHGFAFLQYGYADVPLAFFGFLTFHALYRDMRAVPVAQNVLLSILFAAGTILTKQGGVFVIAAVVIFVIWFLRKNPQIRLLHFRAAALIALFGFCFAAGWFVYKYLQVHAGTDHSNLTLLTQNLHYGRTYLQRLAVAAQLLWHGRASAGPTVVSIFTALLIASLFLRQTRWITAFLILPFLFLWGIYFSYEIRTASPVFPFIALVSGIVIDRVIRLATGRFDVVGWKMVEFGPLLAAIAILLVSCWFMAGQPGLKLLPEFFSNDWIQDAATYYSGPAAFLSVVLMFISVSTSHEGVTSVFWPITAFCVFLVATIFNFGSYDAANLKWRQVELRKKIGDESINARLYRAVAELQIHDRIMTDYWFLRALPGLEPLFRMSTCSGLCSYEQIKSGAFADPKTRYVFMPAREFDPATLAKFATSRDFVTIYNENGMMLLQMVINPKP